MEIRRRFGSQFLGGKAIELNQAVSLVQPGDTPFRSCEKAEIIITGSWMLIMKGGIINSF
jgi:hypothetical protein